MLKTVGFPATRTGDQTIVGGNLVIGTSGKGIDFSAAGGDVLTMYDEGTWTPVRNGFTEVIGGGSITTSGTYTRVGRLVTVVATITAIDGATIAGSSGIGSWLSGLPFSCATPTSATWVNSASVADSGGVLVNATELYLTNGWAATGGAFRFNATYFV